MTESTFLDTTYRGICDNCGQRIRFNVDVTFHNIYYETAHFCSKQCKQDFIHKLKEDMVKLKRVKINEEI